MPLEGLYTPKAIPNLDIKFSGLIYPTTYFPHLSCYPLTTSKTPNSSYLRDKGIVGNRMRSLPLPRTQDSKRGDSVLVK